MDEHREGVEVLFMAWNRESADFLFYLIDDYCLGFMLKFDFADVEGTVGFYEKVDLASTPSFGLCLTVGAAVHNLVFNSKQCVDVGLVVEDEIFKL